MALSSFNVKITGAKELDKLLKMLPQRMSRKIVRAALRKAARPMLKDAKAGIPKKSKQNSGKTRRDLKIRNIPNSKPLAVAIAGSRAKNGRDYIMRFLEFGTVKQTARPFLRPAFDKNAEKALRILVEEIKTRLLKEAAKMAGRK